MDSRPAPTSVLKARAEAAAEGLRRQLLQETLARRRELLFLNEAEDVEFGVCRAKFYKEAESPEAVLQCLREVRARRPAPDPAEEFLQLVGEKTCPLSQLRGWASGNLWVRPLDFDPQLLENRELLRPGLLRAVIWREFPELQLEALNFLIKLTCDSKALAEAVADRHLVQALETAVRSPWELLRVMALICVLNLVACVPKVVFGHWMDSGRPVAFGDAQSPHERGLVGNIYGLLLAHEDTWTHPELAQVFFRTALEAYNFGQPLDALHSILYGLASAKESQMGVLAGSPEFCRAMARHSQEVEEARPMEMNLTKTLMIDLLCRLGLHEPQPPGFGVAFQQVARAALCCPLIPMRCKLMRKVLPGLRPGTPLPSLLLSDPPILKTLLEEAHDGSYERGNLATQVLARLCLASGEAEALILLNNGIIDVFTLKTTRKTAPEVLDEVVEGCAALITVLGGPGGDPGENVAVEAITRSGLATRLESVFEFQDRQESQRLAGLREQLGLN